MESDAQACQSLFSCTLCGDCCKGYGGTYVSEADMDAIARYLGQTAQWVKARYTRLSGGGWLIAQGENGYCLFWDKVCTIHPVKPKMCRRWPFIPSILVDVGNWRAMASSCPGMNADADERVIRECVQEKLGKGANH